MFNMSKKSFIVLCACSVLQGCGIFGTAHGWMRMQARMPDKTSVLVIPAPELARDEEFQKHIHAFTLMALFAKVVYRQDIPDELRSELGCRYPGTSYEKFGMPALDDGAGWSRMPILISARGGSGSVESCYDKHGLFYETYQRRAARAVEPDMIVIAIRGTENYNLYQKLRDWSANLAAFFNFDPGEYRYAREAMLPLIAELRAQYPSVPIYLTGHSLGGGIAQQIAYISPEVKAVYVFDSSPVTNWTHLVQMDPPIIPKDHDPLIYRVSHTNEFLQGPRAIATRLTATRINRADYEFFFQKTGRVGDHEMGILACNFALRSIETGADFDFPADYARHMLNDKAICPLKLIVRNAEFTPFIDWGDL